jgi:FkbM family methyltransferase
VPRLDPVTDPLVTSKPWEKRPPFAQRLRKFAASPLREQFAILIVQFRRLFPNLPVPYRLSFGSWFMLGDGTIDRGLLWDCFETAELRFVEKFLEPGMCVLDVGAHHGLYTLLAAKRVGRGGKVIAFEPSPRERHLLVRNLRLNFVSNVHIESYALGSGYSKAKLFLVEGSEDGCNSLRPPAVAAVTQIMSVDVISLDDYLSSAGVSSVDFVKLDVEGAEREVLRGASGLLNSSSPPIFFVEVQDIRTRPWGYPACEIVQLLNRAGYDWFRVLNDGNLVPAPIHDQEYDANLVAVPRDRVAAVLRRFGG